MNRTSKSQVLFAKLVMRPQEIVFAQELPECPTILFHGSRGPRNISFVGS